MRDRPERVPRPAAASTPDGLVHGGAARSATYDEPDLGDHDWTRRLAALPDRYRVPIVLHCIEDLSYEETAEALDRPVGTVKAQIHRGLTGLREMQLDNEAVR